MAVIDRPRLNKSDLRQEIASLRPGDVFSIHRPITVDEFYEYAPEEGRSELVNGVIHVMPPPSDAHEALVAWLLTILLQYAQVRGLGEVRASRSGVQISRTSVREPDILFFRKDRLDQMTPRGVHGAPDLAIEIVESRKARRDAVEKQAQYEAVGVAELWVIDLPLKEVRQYVMVESEFQPVTPETEGLLVSRAVEGFQLQTVWLFGGPEFPNSLEVVQALLADH